MTSLLQSLHLTDPPDAPFILPIQHSDIHERSIQISWTVNTNPRSPIRYFSLQLSKNNGGWQDKPPSISASVRKLTVYGLNPGQSYRFRIMSTNDVGNSPFSLQSNIVTTRPTGWLSIIVLFTKWKLYCFWFTRKLLSVPMFSLRPSYTARFCRMQPPYHTLTHFLGHDFRKVLKHVLKSYGFFRVVSVL